MPIAASTSASDANRTSSAELKRSRDSERDTHASMARTSETGWSPSIARISRWIVGANVIGSPAVRTVNVIALYGSCGGGQYTVGWVSTRMSENFEFATMPMISVGTSG